MNPHDEIVLDAYVDGALNAADARRFEAHLAGCPACQELTQQRRALSALLRSAPPAGRRKSEDRFVAEITLRMPRHAARPARSGLAQWGWRLVPVGLLAGMIFLEIALWGATLLGWLPGSQTLLAGLVEMSWLGGLVSAPAPLSAALSWLGPLNYWSMSGLAGVALLALFALMYLGWMASWWTGNQSN